ncbi:MAG: hypothetical protein ACE5IC_03080 [Candidatus Brocadiales bacterium]
MAISFFLILMGLSMGVAFWNFYQRTSFSPEKVALYYLGNVREDEPEDAPLPEEGLMFPKSYREMAESTHVHAFTIPLIFFVLSRILNMTMMREGVKIATHVTAFVGIVLNLTGPWLVRFVSPSFSAWLIASYVLLGSVVIVYITYPMYEMWGAVEMEESGKSFKG